MNLKSLVVVVLRIYALNFLLLGLLKSFPFIFRLTLFDEESFTQKLVPWGIILTFVVIALVIWFLASPIAKVITRNLPDKNVSLVSLTLPDCYTIAFIGVGLFYTVGYIAGTLNWFHYIFKLAVSTSGNSWKEEVDWYSALASIIPFAVGIVLLVKAKFWADKLVKFHYIKKSELDG